MHAASRNLTLEQHIRRRGALLAEIVAMRPPPGREGAVALALVKDKGLVGNGHFMMLENNRRDVFDAIRGWLEQKIPART